MSNCMAGSSGGGEKPRLMMTSTGICFSSSDASSSGNPSNIQAHLFEPVNPEIYNLTSGMEMVGFPSKNHHENTTTSIFWKEFFNNKPGNTGPSSSRPINEPTDQTHFNYQNQQQDLTGISDTTNETLIDSSSCWNHHPQNRILVEDPSLRCVFSCEGNERPSQGLSLSLSSSNPSTIGLQSFELRQHEHEMRFEPSSSRSVNIQQQQPTAQQAMMMQQLGQFQIRNSKYLGPAQDLLNEFCNLGPKKNDGIKMKGQKNDIQWENNESAAMKKQSLYSLDLLELQKRKAKLLQMLEEVDRRYKHYCDQMKAVVSSFEAVAGAGAATVYSALASRAMSRHFRCLRDGIVGQIKATKKAMGDKDTAAPGTTKGETPRLRLLDQTLRQQRTFQQMGMMETHPWRPQRGLPERSVSVLRAWLFEHFLHPYPSDVDKHILARQTGLSRSQVSNWFINARVRLWKPMVEEMYMEELKDHEGLLDGAAAAADNQNPPRNEDQKPTHDQLVRIDSECLSSIINSDKTDGGRNKAAAAAAVQNDHGFGRVGDSFGAIELDFSSYNAAAHHSAAGPYVNENGAAHNYGGGGGGGGVSLTLGLHQHDASGGVSLAFSPAAAASQTSLFYPRDHMETVQYSLLDSESQNLPYRNLMGAQLLHDLAG